MNFEFLAYLEDPVLAVKMPELKIIQLSEGFERLTGLTSDRVIQRPLKELVPVNFESLSLKNIPYESQIPIEIYHINGNTISCRLNIFEADQEICVLQFILQTENIEGLRDASYYAQILDSIQDLVICKNKNFQITYFNKALQDYYSITPESILGKKDSPVNDPENTRLYNEIDALVFKTGQAAEVYAEPSIDNNNETRYFHTIKAPIFNDQGEAFELVGISRDVTKYRQQDELIELNQRLQSSVIEIQNLFIEQESGENAFRRALSLICEFTESQYGIICENANSDLDKAKCNLRARQDDSKNQNITSFICEHFSKKIMAMESLFIANNSFEISSRFPDLSIPRKMFSLIGIPLKNAGIPVGAIILVNGAPLASPEKIENLRPLLNALPQLMYVAKLREERRRFQEELLAAKEAAQEAEKMKSIFVSNMSHEIRTPLNSILGFTDLAMDSVQNEVVREYLSSITQSGRLLLNIVNDVLDFAKIESNFLKIVKEPFSLQHMVHSIVKSAQLIVLKQKKDIDISYEFEPEIPVTIIADEHRISQILFNLVGNAVKFTQSGKINVQVLQSADHHISFRVTDTGPGVLPENREKIFKPFEQEFPGTDRKYGGTGLGLSISKKLAELMCGSLELEQNSPNMSGCTFKLSVPYELYRGRDEQDHEIANYEEASVYLKNKKILIVEDEIVNRLLLKKILELAGSIIDEVENGFDAVDQFIRNSYDVILMDVMMPGLNGLDATRQIRKIEEAEKRQPIPIIFLSAAALTDDIEAGKKAGGTLYLTKPVERSHLIKMLSQIFNSIKTNDGI